MGADRVNGFLGNRASQIQMDGLADPGKSLYSAREDHVHPADTSRAGAEHTHPIAHGVMMTKKIVIETTDWVAKTEPDIGFTATVDSGIDLAVLTFDVLTTVPFDTSAALVRTAQITLSGTSENSLVFDCAATEQPANQVALALVYSTKEPEPEEPEEPEEPAP